MGRYAGLETDCSCEACREPRNDLAKLIDDARILFAALSLSDAGDYLNEPLSKAIGRWKKKANMAAKAWDTT